MTKAQAEERVNVARVRMMMLWEQFQAAQDDLGAAKRELARIERDGEEDLADVLYRKNEP